MVTKIRLNSERKLIPTPILYKHTTVTNKQVAKICLLQTLCRKLQKNQDPQSTISQLQTYKVFQTLTLETIPQIMVEERQYLRQLQADIDIHQEYHLPKLACEARKAQRLANLSSNPSTTIDEVKEKTIALIEMRL